MPSNHLLAISNAWTSLSYGTYMKRIKPHLFSRHGPTRRRRSIEWHGTHPLYWRMLRWCRHYRTRSCGWRARGRHLVERGRQVGRGMRLLLWHGLVRIVNMEICTYCTTCFIRAAVLYVTIRELWTFSLKTGGLLTWCPTPEGVTQEYRPYHVRQDHRTKVGQSIACISVFASKYDQNGRTQNVLMIM